MQLYGTACTENSKSSSVRADLPSFVNLNKKSSKARVIVSPDSNNNTIALSPEELAAHTAKMLEFGRALCGKLDTGARGHQALTLTIDFRKNPERACTLENHFKHGTCARELMGYLESEEARIASPDRFLFHSMDTLRENCFKGPRANAVNYSRRDFFYSVRILRALGILSPRVERNGRDGIIVAPHGALCHRTEKECRFVGILEAFQRQDVGTFSIHKEGDGAIWLP
jgi:hypothetical protein